MKWEYCRLTHEHDKDEDNFYVQHVQPEQQTIDIRKQVPSWTLDLILTDLGLQGWEMCGCLQDGENIHIYIFKRQIKPAGFVQVK